MEGNKKEVFISFLSATLFWLPLIAIVVYSGNRNNYEYCDKVSPNSLPKICKLQYPIMNTAEIKQLTKENEELQSKVRQLETRLEDLKDVLENGKEDNWEPDPVQSDY